MTDRAAAASGRRRLPAALRRRFEAIVFGWDGTAVAGRESDATRIRRLVEEACAAGLELAIVSSRCVDEVDGQLAAPWAAAEGIAAALVDPSISFQACLGRGARVVSDGDGDGDPGLGRARSMCGRIAGDHRRELMKALDDQRRPRALFRRPLRAATPARVFLASHRRLTATAQAWKLSVAHDSALFRLSRGQRAARGRVWLRRDGGVNPRRDLGGRSGR